MLLTVLSFIAVLIVIVLAHECGHFFVARAFGVRVDEFGIGFPPRLFSIKRGGVRYSINALPIGGFVKLAGEEDPSVPGSLAGKKTGVRVLVLVAGSLMNALLPVLLFSIALMVPHNIVSGQVLVEGVPAGSPAALAGIQAGDTLLEIDGKTMHNNSDLQRSIQSHLGNEVTILVRHGDATTESVSVIPRWRPPEGEGAIGVVIRTVDPTLVRESYPFWRAIPMGVMECIETFLLFKNVIISMILGSVPVVLAGPVGIAQITGEAARAGLSPLLEFAAFFSINLAIINLFPIPALDGGRIVFVLLEWVRRGKRVPPRIEGMVHLTGFFLLIGMMILFTYQDIIRIITGESLIP